MSKLTDKEIQDLVALARQCDESSIEPAELTDFEKFAVELNLSPGLDEIPFLLLWDYYRRWTASRATRIKFGEFLSNRYEKVKRSAHAFYLINESALTVKREDMKRKIGERLYEQQKTNKKKEKI